MPPRRGLGRGLDALIARPPTGDAAAPNGAAAAQPGAVSAQFVEIGRIEPNPRQPRRQMPEQQLEELAASIREHGIIQPLLVTQIPSPGGTPRYQLIAGERRWAAAKRAGLVRVPVVVREAAGPELLELALVENVQREDLNPLEEAAAYQQLAGEFGLTQDQIGRRVGKSRFAVNNTMRLLQLPATIQQAVLDGQLSEGHARAILGLRDRAQQERLAKQVVERALSVRQTEELVRRRQEPALPSPKGGRPVDRQAQDIEDRFRSVLGTRVSVSRGKRGGRLVIYYFDDEQLQGIYERLGGTE
jgi:ParB family chromosome partitioning protein